MPSCLPADEATWLPQPRQCCKITLPLKALPVAVSKSVRRQLHCQAGTHGAWSLLAPAGHLASQLDPFVGPDLQPTDPSLVLNPLAALWLQSCPATATRRL